MTELNFHQLQKDNEEHYKLLLTLMLTYNKELEEHTLSCSKTTETVFELTRGMLNMQGPFDRHLELCYLGDDLIGFFYSKVDHEGHKGFIKPGYGYIMEFYVLPQFRRYGFGKSMFARLQTLFASHGTKRMYLTPGSAAGISFWEALGFISTGEVSPHNRLLIFEKDVFEIIEVLEKEAKSEICKQILIALSLWFNIPQAVNDYINQVQEMPFYACFLGRRAVGFIAIKQHNSDTAEVYVMGVLSEYHRQGLGTRLINEAVKLGVNTNRKFLTVKTLAEFHLDESYANTRKFYRALGFMPLEINTEIWGKTSSCLLMVKPLANLYTIKISSNLTQELIRKVADFKWHSTEPKMLNIIREVLYDTKRKSDCFNVIAFNRQEEVIGILFCVQNQRNPKLWYYGDLLVAPRYRHLKIATQMVNTAIEKIADMGGEVIHTYVEQSNIASINLQQSLGFIQRPFEKFDELLNDGQIMFERNIQKEAYNVIPATANEALFAAMLYEDNRDAIHGKDISLKEWQEALAGNKDEENFLICQGAICYAWIQINDLSNKDTAWISKLVVDNKKLRQGIGSWAVSFAEDYIKSKGFNKVAVHTTVDNTIAQNFYRKCGYTLTKDHDIVTDDGVKRSGFTFEKIISPQITAYALNSLQDRINYKGPLARDVSYLEPASGEICRIIYSCGKTVISVRENLSNKLKTYLDTIQLYLEIQKPDFYKKLLQALDLNATAYTLEPMDELIENKYYNCIHSLEFICNQQSIKPIQPKVSITEIKRGNKDFTLADNFGDTMYCILQGEKLASTSFYRPNHGKYEGTFSVEVVTKNEYRGQGYGKAVASAATAQICSQDGLALWVAQVENKASIRLARSIGYEFLGAEIIIKD